MNIDLSILLAIVTGVAGLFFGMTSHNNKKEEKNEEKIKEIVGMATQIKNVDSNVEEIKKTLSKIDTTVDNLKDEVAVVRNMSEKAHSRIDVIEQKPPKKGFFRW